MLDFILMAEGFAETSSDEHKVGAIILNKEGKASYSYNRPPRGSNDTMRDRKGHTRETTIHAEEGAILMAARLGIPLEHATLYCTHSPCIRCAKMILEVGIDKVIFKHQYKKGEQALKWLHKHGVSINEATS